MRLVFFCLALFWASAADAQTLAADPALNPVTTICGGGGTTLTKAFSNAGSSNAIKLIAGVAGTKVRICAVSIGPVAGAVNVALIEGTTVTNPCDTGAAGLMTGATAATGWQFAINGSIQLGNGGGVLAQEATAGDDVCLLFSADVQVSGVVAYSQF